MSVQETQYDTAKQNLQKTVRNVDKKYLMLMVL